MSQNTKDRDEVREQIRYIRRAMERDENAGDPSFIDEYCMDDVVVIPPGQPPIVGKEAGKQVFEEMFGALDIDLEFTSEEVVVGADLAIDRITSQETHTPKAGGEPTEKTADALYMYRRSPDGDWKVSHMMAAYRE